MEAWVRIRGALERQPRAFFPVGGRLGAALALLSETGDGGFEFVYTRRREDLTNHPGQISFPGGRVEPGEEVEAAAVREAVEEVGLDPATVTVLGTLEAFYIPPSRFWLSTVVARWDRPHPLVAAEAEVAEVLHVAYARLIDPSAWRVVWSASAGGWLWAWQLGAGRLLWGATAIATVALLDLLDPNWRQGASPADLHQAHPWQRGGPHPGPPRLRDTPEVPADAMAHAEPGAERPAPAEIEAGGAAVAGAAAELAGGRGRVLVLAGPGRAGAVALAAAARLHGRGIQVGVVLTEPPETLPELVAEMDGTVTAFAGTLPDADVVIDGLVGAGLDGPLRGAARDAVHALRLCAAQIVSIDVPSGLDPERGLIGDAVAADVTVALGWPRQGLFRPELSPYVGDVYAADLRDGSLVRLVATGALS